jgi:hypothetical protein
MLVYTRALRRRNGIACERELLNNEKPSVVWSAKFLRRVHRVVGLEYLQARDCQSFEA